jgi:heat shock protein HtpX
MRKYTADVFRGLAYNRATVRSTSYLLWRAAVAVVLMVAFYGLALAAAAALAVLPVLLARVSVGFAFKAALFGFVGAFLILKAIVPRRDHFEPPGPRLDAAAQPRLFAEIRGIAAATRQAEPAEVYLLAEVNAFVTYRGGLMGLGSRRVMGLGLPLLQTLTVPELRAVLAHEFGHLDGGDVAIGPWIYSTRAALIRTMEDLHEHSEFLTLPFQWFANLFFRVTHAISRHQEVKADQLAATVVGREPLASGLQATDAAAFVFVPYWHASVDPLLSAGFLPPIAAGFDTFRQAPWLEGALSAREPAAENPFDTHPPLPARLAALGVTPSDSKRDTGPRALSLLDDVPALEGRLAAHLTNREGRASSAKGSLSLTPEPRALTPITWDEVGSRVWLPDWEKIAAKYARHLKGVTPAQLPTFDWERLGRRLTAGESDAQPLQAADSLLGIALGVALARSGFIVHSIPGRSPALVRADDRVEPFDLREHLASGPDAVPAWQDLCARLGIADVDLGSLGKTRPGPP